jgi:GWxTD domain-containing protein
MPRTLLVFFLLPLLYAQSPKQRDAKLRKELSTPYLKVLEEDLAYIITDEERQAFRRLSTDDERERFIEQFWLRRDPTPDTVENEYREEHYRRITYANEHYASGLPGWKSDRGRIYIKYGAPDEIDPHPSGSTYQRPMEEGGGQTRRSPSSSGATAISKASAQTWSSNSSIRR